MEDILEQQLQAEINNHFGSSPSPHSVKAKRKSRDEDESGDYGVRENPKKRNNSERRNKRERRERRRARRASEALSEAAGETIDVSAPKKAPTPKKLAFDDEIVTNQVPQTANCSDRHSTQAQNGSHPTVLPGRLSFGATNPALLKSILKDCTPDKFKNLKADPSTESVSDIEGNFVTRTRGVDDGDAEYAPRVTKERARPKVSMVPILPEGYEPGPAGAKGRYHCPVEGCDKRYARRTTLGEHMNVSILFACRLSQFCTLLTDLDHPCWSDLKRQQGRYNEYHNQEGSRSSNV
jgi:hypothetical protein